MTDNHAHTPADPTNKRKSGSVIADSSRPKRSRKDGRKSKSTRERDRIMLENFVKYGILPSSPKSKLNKNAAHRPEALVRTAKRLSEDQRVPDIEPCPTGNTRLFWRPWVDTAHNPDTRAGIRNSSRTVVVEKSHISFHKHSSSNQHHAPSEFVSVPHGSPSRQEITKGATQSRELMTDVTSSGKVIPSSPTVTTWDTRSPEFLKSFKQPVRLMWPRSQAFDFKYRDAQQLLHSFPVQAAIDFYDDQDGPEDKLIHSHFRQFMTSQQCASVMN